MFFVVVLLHIALLSHSIGEWFSNKMAFFLRCLIALTVECINACSMLQSRSELYHCVLWGPKSSHYHNVTVFFRSYWSDGWTLFKGILGAALVHHLWAVDIIHVVPCPSMSTGLTPSSISAATHSRLAEAALEFQPSVSMVLLCCTGHDSRQAFQAMVVEHNDGSLRAKR